MKQHSSNVGGNGAGAGDDGRAYGDGYGDGVTYGIGTGESGLFLILAKQVLAVWTRRAYEEDRAR